MYLFLLCQTIQALVNLTPNLTNTSGSCEASSASLILTQEQTTTLNFTFTLVRSSLPFCGFGYMLSSVFICACVYSTRLLPFTELHKQQVSPECDNSARSLVWYDWYVICHIQHTFFFSFLQSVTDPSLSTAPLSVSNTSLNYLRSTLGHSYMCNAEQILAVVPTFSLNTFRLQVQPFEVTSQQFATGTSVIHFLSQVFCIFSLWPWWW